MTKSYHTLLCLLMCLVMLGGAGSAQEQNKNPDEICGLLFETYIERRGKINTSTIMAASHIVAERGRNTGF